MLACLSPVCSKPFGAQDGKISETWKHGNGKFFTCQIKRMASRLAGGPLSKYCKPVCGTGAQSELHGEGFPVHSAPGEKHSPKYSLKSYQVNGRTSSRRDMNGDSEKQFDSVQPSSKALRPLHKNFAKAGLPEGEGECKVDDGGVKYKACGDEWVAEVNPGVYITFSTGADGLNDLKRIKFSRAMFSKQDAETWWRGNCPRIRALYKVRPPSLNGVMTMPTITTDDDVSSGHGTPDSYTKSPCSSYNGGDYLLTRRRSSADARLKDSDSESGGPHCNALIEQDETGVYLTIICVPGGGKQLKRVRFSRDKFSEGEAAAWWEHNRQRIYAQYIFTNTTLQGK